MYWLAIVNKKIKKWKSVRENWASEIQQKRKATENYIWIHCASAGEFEQAIPIIFQLKEGKYKNHKIAVSFFSPSGYEAHQNNELIDLIFYLPIDTYSNTQKLVEFLQPEFAIFIRNEIWLNCLFALNRKQIPTYLINVNANRSHSFFYKKYLDFAYPLFTKIFDTTNFGNTKIERVIQNSEIDFQDSFLDKFCKDNFVIILGSCWEIEENWIAEFYKKQASEIKNLKIILAPHEYDETKIKSLEKIFEQKIGSYVALKNKHKNEHKILMLDQNGILKYVYRYGDLAIIGGGFGKGVHNISEAAVYEMSVLFGPNFTKFEEVPELINCGIAHCIHSYEEMEKLLLDVYFSYQKNEHLPLNELHNFLDKQKNTSTKIVEIIIDENKKRGI
ncbi:MAG: hypothetical protein KDD21_06190 [Bacteroidetes bacterium]|nr:hypothetical protein [Bacteroidota bacterium]